MSYRTFFCDTFYTIAANNNFTFTNPGDGSLVTDSSSIRSYTGQVGARPVHDGGVRGCMRLGFHTAGTVHPPGDIRPNDL